MSTVLKWKLLLFFSVFYITLIFFSSKNILRSPYFDFLNIFFHSMTKVNASVKWLYNNFISHFERRQTAAGYWL